MSKQILTVLGFRRPDTLQQTCEALLDCRDIDKYSIYLYIDKAPSQIPKQHINHPFFQNIHSENQQSIEYAKKLESIHSHVHTYVASDNFGITKMTDSCMKQAFRLCEFWTHFEEDVLPMPDALEFLQWGQEYLLKYPHILETCAYGEGEYKNESYANLALIYGGFCPWGFCVHRTHQHTMGQILSQHNIVMPTWDSVIGDMCQANNLCLLRPCISRIDKIGYDQRSMHEWRHQPRDKSNLFDCEKQNFEITKRSIPIITNWAQMQNDEKKRWHWSIRKPIYKQLNDGIY